MQLALAIGFVQGHDVVGGLVGDITQVLKEIDPQLAKVAHARGVAFKHAAVVFEPLRLVEVNLALFDVDAMLAEHERALVAVFEQDAQNARVAGGDGVVNAGGRAAQRHFTQAPERRVHVADGPEVIDKGGVGAAAAVTFFDEVPRGFAVQEDVMADLAVGARFIEQLGEQVRAVRVFHVGLKQRVHAFHLRHGVGRGLGGHDGRIVLGLEQVGRFQVHQVVWQGVAHIAIVFGAAAQKDGAKAQLGKAPDDLVDPARHAARHKGEGAFEQQQDINAVRAGKVRFRCGGGIGGHGIYSLGRLRSRSLPQPGFWRRH